MMQRSSSRDLLDSRVIRLLAAAIALLSFVGPADAQTLTWSGTGSFQGPGTWDAGTSSNWWNGTANQLWTAGGTAAFGVSTGIGSTVTVSGSVNAGGVVFNPLSVTGATAGSSFTLTGGTIGIGSGNSILTSGTASNTNGLHTINSTLVGSNLSVGRAPGAGSSTSAVSGIILSGTNQFLTGTLTVGGTVNTQSVRVYATGSAVSGLSSVVVGASSVFGASADGSVFNSNIQLGANSQLLNTFGSMTASGTISLAGDGVNLTGNSGKTMTLQGPIVDASGGSAKTLTLYNRGTTVLTGASTFSGTWALGQPNSGGVVILDGGDNRLPAAASLSFTTNINTLVLGTSAALNQTIASLTSDSSKSSNAVMAGAGGTSTLTVNLASGTNTFYGRLGGTSYTVSGGVISNANGNNLALVKSGAGTLVLGNANTYTGTTAVTGGTLLFDPSIYASGTDTTISNLLASTGTITIGSGATLALNGRANQASATLTSGSYNQTSQTVTVASTAGLVPGAIISGSGIAAGTYVQAVLSATQFLANQAISSGTFSGQSLTVGAANFTTAQSIAGLALSAGTGTVSVSNAGQGTSLTVTGPVTGSGALSKIGDGTLALTGVNTFTGGATLNAGTIRLGASTVMSGGTIASGPLGTGAISIPAATGTNATLAGNDSATKRTINNTINIGSSVGIGSVIIGDGVNNASVELGGTITNFWQSRTFTNNLSGNGVLTLSGTMFMDNANASRVITFNGPGNTVLSGVFVPGVTGTTGGAFTYGGSGTTTLSGSFGYTGATTVSGTGTVILGSSAALGQSGSSAVTFQANATLQSQNDALSFSNNWSINSGSLLNVTFSGQNSLGLTGTFTNATQSQTLTNSIAGGKLLTLGAIHLSESASGRTFTLAGTGNTTIGGVISNGTAAGVAAGGLTISNSGTTTINAANTYSGQTTFSSGIGTVVVGNNTALGTGGVLLNTNSTPTLQSANDNVSLANNLTLSMGHTLSFTVSGPNSLGLTGTMTNQFFNNVLTNNIAGGKSLTLGAINLSQDTNQRLFTLAGSGNTTIGGVIANGTAAGVAANSLTISNSGTTTLTGANTYSGTTTLSGGVVNLGAAETAGTSGPLGRSAAANAGSIVLAGGALQYSSANQNDYSGRFSTAASQAYNVDTNGQSVTWATALTSSGGTLTKSGSGVLSLTGSNTFTGATSITAGQLQIGSAGSINSSSGITINGATAEFKYNSATALTKPITFTQGTLSGTGTINTPVSIGASAILSPGNSPGTQTYQSGTFAAGGSYTWEINNWTSGTAGVNYDQAIFTNGLAITSSSASRFTINLTSLKADNTTGAVPGFNSGLTGLSFNIATGTMTGYSPLAFTLGTSSFLAANTVSGSANGGFWLSTNSGSTVLTLNYAPSARYTLSATPAATAIYAGGTTVITGSITSSTADRTNADAMVFSNLSVGSGSLSVTSGTLSSGAATAGTMNFSSGSAGLFTFTPTVSATNVNLGTAALAGTVSSGSVAVWNPAAVNALSAVSLGNVRVGGSFGTSALTITNTAASSAYTEALGATGSTTGAASLTGSVSALAGGSSSTAISVGLGNANTATAGVKSGSTTLNFTSTGGLGTFVPAPQTIAVTGTVWNPAAANAISGTLNLGTVLKGGVLSQALSIQNTAPNNGFSEKLDAGFGTLAGVTTNSGSISLLGPQATDTSTMVVGLSTATAGGKTGSAEVNFWTNGQGTSGLAPLQLASQTVSLTGTVLDPAVASFASGSAATASLLLDFGDVNQNASITPLAFSLYNLMQTNGYTADLALLNVVSGTGNTSTIATTLPSQFFNLASGSSFAYSASLSTASLGTFQNVYTLQFKSANNGAAFNADATQNLTLTVKGVVIVPEPGAIALAGVGVGLAGWSLWKRRRTTA